MNRIFDKIFSPSIPLSIAFAFALAAFVGCADQPRGSTCPDGQTWHAEQEHCVANSGTNSGNGANSGGSNSGGSNSGGSNDGNNDGPCVNLGCDQVDCSEVADAEASTTSLSGVVTIPSGELPLPNVSVYVPNAELEPIAEGSSCERCENMLSGQPLVSTTTNTQGQFYLEDVPVGQNIPLVIQTGKWRRSVEVTQVESCTDNFVDAEKTRLPRNQSEGHIPKIAVTTGACDALECILYKIGLDDAEFTTHTGNGRVHMYAGPGGSSGWSTYEPTNSFHSSHPTGAESFPDATIWWEQIGNLTPYDIILKNCECSPLPDEKSDSARTALETFADRGGRVFLSHWQNTWLEHSHQTDFVDVANWRSSNAVFFSQPVTGFIDDSFAGGHRMKEWMHIVNALNADDGVEIHEGRITVQNIDPNLAERWLYIPYQGSEWDHYFAFNTPVHAPEENECGRVVFSDLHVSAGNESSPDHPFPTGCTSAELTPQEIALVYLLFDLSACIADCIPLRCDDIVGACGTEPDGCGGHVECDECCVQEDEECTTDDDCCLSMWCDDDTKLCTNRCRPDGTRCTENSQCCSDTCTGIGGDEGVCISG